MKWILIIGATLITLTGCLSENTYGVEVVSSDDGPNVAQDSLKGLYQDSLRSALRDSIQAVADSITKAEDDIKHQEWLSSLAIEEDGCATIEGKEYCYDYDDRLVVEERECEKYDRIYDQSRRIYVCVEDAAFDYILDEQYTSNDTTYHAGSCFANDLYTWENIKQTPLYQGYDKYLQSITNGPAEPLQNPGKIYQIGQWKFINEIDKGIHVYDNSDPTQPVYKTFITIPGNRDIAIKDETILADSYSNLLAIDFSNPENVSVHKDLVRMFEGKYQNGYEILDPDSGLIIDWKIDTTWVTRCNYNYYYDYDMYENDGWYGEDMIQEELNAAGDDRVDNDGAKAVGQGGSLARFALSQEYLYVVTESELVTFLARDETNPQYSSRQTIGWGIETVYMEAELLFVGSSSAMFIYDITNPANPKMASEFWHATSCDPVVVEGSYAYVTLRAGTRCRNGDNRLEVIDVSDIYNPKLAESYAMDNPAGLGIYDDVLYVCDGAAGLKVFDITQVPVLELISIIDTVTALDLIVTEENLTLIGVKGMYQFDHSNPENLILQSFVESQYDPNAPDQIVDSRLIEPMIDEPMWD